jgi:hypothetical protein
MEVSLTGVTAMAIPTEGIVRGKAIVCYYMNDMNMRNKSD